MENKMNMKKNSTIYLSGVLTIAMSIALVGCDKKGKIPGDAKGRIEGMASVLPKGTEAALFVGDIGKMRETMTTVKSTIGDAVPQLEATQKQVESEIGFDMFDAKAWEGAGLSDKTGFTVAFVDNRLAMVAYVNDRQKFDTFVAEKAKKATESSEAPKTEDVDGKQVKIVGKDDKQIAWVHEGKLAILATSVLEKEMGGDTSTPQKFVVTLSKLESGASAAGTPQFKQFQKAFDSSYGMAGFANAKAIIENDGYKKNREGMVADPAGKVSIEWFEKHAEVIGFGVGQEGDQLEASFFLGADDATNKKFVELSKSTAKMPWAGFATDGIFLGLRTSVNMEKFWPFYLESMTPEQKQQVEAALAEAKKNTGIDIQKEVLEQATGNIGVFFYGLNVGAAMGAAQNPMAAANALNLAVGVQFKDAKALQSLVDKLVAKSAEAGGPPMKPVPVKVDGKDVSDANVIATPDGSIKVVIAGDLLVVGTKELSEADAYKYIKGNSGAKSLSDAGGALGKDFASDKPYNGLYVNVEKVTTLVSAFAAGSPPEKVLKKLSEASLTSENTDNGSFVHLRITTKGGGADK
jgi:hypothetical protein